MSFILRTFYLVFILFIANTSAFSAQVSTKSHDKVHKNLPIKSIPSKIYSEDGVELLETKPEERNTQATNHKAVVLQKHAGKYVLAPYFIAEIKKQLQDKFKIKDINLAGLRITTTLNSKIQIAANNAVQKFVQKYKKGDNKIGPDPEGLEAAAMVMNAQTGAVLAMIGGYDFEKSQFNRAAHAFRQVGSSVKPLYYSYAIDNGFSPLSLLDSPDMDYAGWKPKNHEDEVTGRVTMLRALTKSYNIPSAFLYYTLGTSKVTEQLNRLGFRWPKADLTVSLGSGSATLLQMVQAYSVFPNEGKLSLAYYITQIKDKNGLVLYDQSIDENLSAAPVKFKGAEDAATLPGTLDNTSTNLPQQIISPQAAYVTTYMLKNVIKHGTGRAAAGISPHLGGKTGTTTDSSDAWFIGVGSSLVAGAWVGYDDYFQNLGETATGGNMAAYIWRDIMKKAVKVYPQTSLSVPTGINFVALNKKLNKKQKSSNSLNGIPVIEGTAPGEEFLENALKEREIDARKIGKH